MKKCSNVAFAALAGDKNARRVQLRIGRSYKEVIGTNTNDTNSTTARWLSKIAENTRISEFRFKTPSIATGQW